jgi:hypothetical protein
MSHVKKKRNVFWLSSSKSGWIELKCIKRKRKDGTSSKSVMDHFSHVKIQSSIYNF